MAASPVVGVPPQTLTDRRYDITTQAFHGGTEGLVMREVLNQKPGIVELIVESGNVRRRVEFSVPYTPTPRWLIPTLTQSGHLLALPANWDEEGASPVEPTYIQLAVNALYQFMADYSAIPQWTPTRDGGVQLDWHESGVDLEIEFAPNNMAGYAVFVDQQNRNSDCDGAVKLNLEHLRRIFAERLVRSNA